VRSHADKNYGSCVHALEEETEVIETTRSGSGKASELFTEVRPWQRGQSGQRGVAAV
jgi:hypothetical protein